MSHRPLVFVSGLTVADYLLWNWSLNSNHDVLALVSGLTLPPLAVGCLWLLALTVARLVAFSARRPYGRAGARRARRVNAATRARRQRADSGAGALEQSPASSSAASGSSRKLAA